MIVFYFVLHLEEWNATFETKIFIIFLKYLLSPTLSYPFFKATSSIFSHLWTSLIWSDILLSTFIGSQPAGRPRSHKVAFALGTSLGCICLLILGFGLLLWWRQRHNQQIFFDVNGKYRRKKKKEDSMQNLNAQKYNQLQV